MVGLDRQALEEGERDRAGEVGKDHGGAGPEPPGGGRNAEHDFHGERRRNDTHASASGTGERAAAEAMLGRQAGRHRATLGADKAYDAAGLVAGLRALNVTPHVAQNTSGRRSAIDARTTRHPG